MLLDSALVTAVLLLTATTVSLLVAQAGTARRLTMIERQLSRAERHARQGPDSPRKDKPLTHTPPPGIHEGDAVDIEGATPDGDEITIHLEGTATTTLLAFLSSDCGICARIWTGVRDEGTTLGGAAVVVVTKDPTQEDLERVRQLSGAGTVRTVMSSEAWADYEVPRSPYVIVVGGRPASVLAEGAVDGWDGVVALASAPTDRS